MNNHLKIFYILLSVILLAFHPVANAEKDHCDIDSPATYNNFENYRQKCEQLKHCKYVPPGECYCPPEVKCICGGGNPPKCIMLNNNQSYIHISALRNSPN